MRLTDSSVRALKPTARQVFYRDETLPGFGVRVSPKGVRSFCLMHGADRRLTTIGRYPIITLSQARDAAKRILAEKTLGHYQPRSIRFDEAVELFISTHCVGLRTAYEYARMLRREFPSLKTKTLDKITPYDLTAIFDRLSPAVAEHAFTYARAFFNWAISRSYIQISPLQRMKGPSKTNSRERVLTDAELRAVWNAATDSPYGTIVRLLILTGQRRAEIAELKWPYINGNTINLPRTKNGRAHTFPIGPMAQGIIERTPRLNSTEFLFPSRTLTSPFNAWSRYKTALDEQSGVSEWTLHDLRRTFVTGLASLSVRIHVVEKLLNHTSGAISGVAAIYNRFTYAEEMRAAVSSWERHLASLFANEERPHATRAA